MWFTSDWHFGHKNVLHFGDGRPFGSVEEMNAALIDRYNAMVAPGEQVWVLGDVAMGCIADSLQCCAALNGRKILICGNHDRPVMAKEDEKVAKWIDRYLDEGGFTGVWTGNDYDLTLPNGVSVQCSHYPYSGDGRDGPDRFLDRRPVDRGNWLLHGHVHDRWRVNGRQVNVGVDVWNYRPVHSDEIEALMQ